MKYHEKTDIEKTHFKPSEASKILGVSQPHLIFIMDAMGYNRVKRLSQDQVDMCRKYLILRRWLKIKPYNVGLLRLIRDI